MRWVGIDTKGKDMDWTIRNMWGPTVALIAHF
jgi:hypothetical protein